jgi:hypothetical protein
MRIKQTLLTGFILIFGLGVLDLSSSTKPDGSVHLSYNRYYDYEALTDALNQLVRMYPQFLKIESIGKSVENRDLWLVTICNPETGNDLDKAAMYIDANIHGNEVQGGEAILYTIDYLMKNYGTIDKVTQLVDERVFYLIPTVNPDGRAHWFDRERFGTGARTGMKPMDNDNDGLYDEDGYDDIDGDGLILQMRKKVAHGPYRPHAEDPRVMERVPAGETGTYEVFGSEGIDNDGDGYINEDGPGGYDMNRNWPHGWQPQYVQRGSGEYPFSFPETRAIGDFILEHPNIAGVQSYHNSGGMILRGPGSRHEDEYPAEDIRTYDFIAKRGEAILPFYRYYIIWKDLYTVHGGTINWTAEGLGIFSYSNELWSSNQYENVTPPPRDPSVDRFRAYTERQIDRLKFDDHVEMGERFVEWKSFTHPTYGEIELGGWVRQTNRVPPLFMLEELCHRNMAFTLFHADQMPRAKIDHVEITKLGRDSYRIRVRVFNDRAMPTISRQGSKNRVIRPDVLTLEGKGMRVISAGLVEDVWLNRIAVVKHRPERILLPEGIPGNGSRIVQFLVSGSGNGSVRLDCAKSRKHTKSFKLD